VSRTDRSAYLYRSRHRPQAALVQRIREIAETRVRYGYRRIHVLLRREGRQVNAKRIYRLYKGFGLQIREPRCRSCGSRRSCARIGGGRGERDLDDGIGFAGLRLVHDLLATGRKIRILTVVDTFTRVAPAIEPRFRYRAEDVVEVFERVGREHGLPKTIRVDQGTEFVSRVLDLWAYHRGVTLEPKASGATSRGRASRPTARSSKA